MNKDAKFQIRVSSIVLEKFDEIVGPKNRSKVLTDYMEYTIDNEFKNQIKELTNYIKKRKESYGTSDNSGNSADNYGT